MAPRGRYYRDGRPDPTMTKERYRPLLQAMDLGGLSPEERRRALETRQAVLACRRRHNFRRRGATCPQDGELRWAAWEPDRLAGLEAPVPGALTHLHLRERSPAGDPPCRPPTSPLPPP